MLDQDPLFSGFHPHHLQSSVSEMRIGKNLKSTSLGSEMPLVLLPCLESLSNSRLRVRKGRNMRISKKVTFDLQETHLRRSEAC